VLSLNAAKPVNITTGGDNNQAGILNKRPAGIARNTEARVITVNLNSFNVLNHPNYVSFIGTQSSPFFGKPVAAQPPRRMQLDVQFKF
jgi:hypothetical protein